MMGMAAVGMIALVALMAFALDAATFFVIKRELQNSADAGALAGVHFLGLYQLQDLPDAPDACDARFRVTQPESLVACTFVHANWGTASKLCEDPAGLTDEYVQPVSPIYLPPPYETIRAPALQVTLHCDARFFLGGIINLQRQPINATALAILASWDPASSEPRIVPYAGGLRSATRLIPVPAGP